MHICNRYCYLLPEPKLITDCEVIWAKFHFKKTKTLYICSFYRPPDSDMYPIIQLNESLTKLSNREPMVLVGGDFNFPDIAWIDGYGTIRPNPAYGFEINNLFLSIIDDNNLEQLVHKPTRIKNIFDLIFSSYPALVSDLSAIPGISDHDAVLFSFNVEGIITNNPRHYIYLYQKADLGDISNYMKTFLDTFISTDPYKNSVEQNWLLFKGAIYEALEKYISKRQIKTSRCIPRITHAIKLKKKERKQLYDIARKIQSHESWEAYRIIRNQVTQ